MQEFLNNRQFPVAGFLLPVGWREVVDSWMIDRSTCRIPDASYQ